MIVFFQVMEYSGHSHGDSGFVGDRLKLTGAGGSAETGGQSSGGEDDDENDNDDDCDLQGARGPLRRLLLLSRRLE